MKKSIQLTAGARDDYLAAQDWYEAQRAGLGEEFLEAVLETLRGLQPTEQYRVVRRAHGQPVRQAHLRRFPYRVVFMELEESIRVLAVAHERRRPGYWLERTSPDP